MTASRVTDRIFLTSVFALVIAGFFIFSSASLGLLARNGAQFSSIAINQVVGLVLGIIAYFITSNVNYRVWRKYALYIMLITLFLNIALFIPGMGIEHGGATRWIDLRIISFQPSEFLKFAVIIYIAAWLSGMKDKIKNFKEGIVPFLCMIGIVSGLLIVQSDTDTLVVILTTCATMLIVAGAKIKHITLIGFICVLGVASIVAVRPYAQQRIMTFLDPSHDPRGAGYQIQQSLIAIGSGGITGRGFGQSLQKFYYLPEPIGDSIFAVQAEEFGLIGCLGLISLYILFALRSLKIASRAPDMYGGLIVVGIVILVVVESFMNMGSMLGLIPLSGMPLLFVSHGGTALMTILGAVGLIANISRYQKK